MAGCGDRMTAFRVRGSPNFRIEVTVEGRRLRRMSTGTRSKAVAEDIERALQKLPSLGYMDLVLQLDAREVTLRELMRAYDATDRRAALDALRARKDDPLVVDLAADYGKRAKDARIRQGYEQLGNLAPATARLSWLRESANVTDLYERAEASGQRPNTVRRGLHRVV